MNPLAKRKMNIKARQYIADYPDCTHEELMEKVGYPELPKAYFLNMRSSIRKKGKELGSSKAESKALAEPGKTRIASKGDAGAPPPLMTVEILAIEDMSGISEGIKKHYQTHLLPLLKKHLYKGSAIQFAFLSDPPQLEIRRLIS